MQNTQFIIRQHMMVEMRKKFSDYLTKLDKEGYMHNDVRCAINKHLIHNISPEMMKNLKPIATNGIYDNQYSDIPYLELSVNPGNILDPNAIIKISFAETMVG